MKKISALWLASSCCVGFASHAQAIPQASEPNQAKAQNQNERGEIIVTAQKRRERLLDVPQSVSVISGDSLEKQHSQRLSDYLTRVPSANVVESQAGRTKIVLRGVNAGGRGATVATYIDETPFGSATSLANGGVLAPDLDPYDLARVEVLRGPQGTLYGANSLGGIVKYVTIAPDPGALAGAGELGTEEVRHGNVGWWGRAAVNVPLTSTIAFRASGFYRRDAGYIDDPLLGKDVNDGKTYGGHLSFLARPSPNLSIRASVYLENIRSNGTNAVDVNPVTLEPSIGDLRHSRLVAEPNNTNYRVYNTTISYDFGPVALVSATSYGALGQRSVFDASGVYGPLLTAVLKQSLGAAVDEGIQQRRTTQEVRLSSTGKHLIDWTVGGFYTHEKNVFTQDLFGVDGVTGDRIAPLDGLVLVTLPSRYTETAGFINATFHLSPRFDLTAGGRYSHNLQSSDQNASGLLAGGASAFSGNSSDNVFTYSVAPSLKLGPNTRVYARVAKGYRPGGPNAVPPLAPTGVPRQFAPDTTINYEVGVKTETDDHLLSAELAAFVIDWKDIQLLAQVQGFGVNTNGGSARSKGVEFTLGLKPMRHLSLYANGSYVDAYLTSDTPGLVGGSTGNQLPYNAKWRGTIGGEYDHQLSAMLAGHAGLSLHYTGRRRGDFDPNLGQARFRAFSQVDAHAGVDFGRFRLDAFAHNLFDSRGIVDLPTFGAPRDGSLAASIIRPRSFGAVLGFSY